MWQCDLAVCSHGKSQELSVERFCGSRYGHGACGIQLTSHYVHDLSPQVWTVLESRLGVACGLRFTAFLAEVRMCGCVFV